MYQKLHRHVWITPGWYPHAWWLGDASSIASQSHCLDKDLEEFLRRGNVLSVVPTAPQPLHTDRVCFTQCVCVFILLYSEWKLARTNRESGTTMTIFDENPHYTHTDNVHTCVWCWTFQLSSVGLCSVLEIAMYVYSWGVLISEWLVSNSLHQ